MIKDWLNDQVTDIQGRTALQTISLIDRKQYITNIKYSVEIHFPEKLSRFNQMVASVAISEWAKDQDLTHLSPLMHMSTEELRDAIGRCRPHVSHKYPNLIAEFTRISNGFLEIADATNLSGQ